MTLSLAPGTSQAWCVIITLLLVCSSTLQPSWARYVKGWQAGRPARGPRRCLQAPATCVDRLRPVFLSVPAPSQGRMLAHVLQGDRAT